MNYYNEIEPYAAEWLRNLIAAGHLPRGVVDTRSIEDVNANELGGFHQCHFFAGIGGWSLALRLAGIPDDQPVWTGSCPCQPFSSAGAKRGTADKRHLWPVWRRLIDQCRPPVVFGEQVASPLGRQWLATVRSEMEALGYAVGAADLCAAGAGAPHIRQRLWFGAATRADPQSLRRLKGGLHVARHMAAHREAEADGAGDGGSPCGLADAETCGDGGVPGSMEEASSTGCLPPQESRQTGDLAGHVGDDVGVADSHRPSSAHSRWTSSDWLLCRDAKWRPVEPGTFPLVDGLPTRMGQLRAYGNAIVPQAAATFIESFIEAIKIEREKWE